MDITKIIQGPQQVISMYRGAGMLDEGVKQAGVQIREIAIVEKEAFAIANVAAEMEVSSMAPCPIWTDSETFPWGHFRKKVHGIIGGYPCTPFSVAGLQEGTDDKNYLFGHIHKGISTVRPLWCFFENVPGHVRMGFDEVVTSLIDLGYDVEAGLFSAAETGGAIVRKRLFFLVLARPYRQVLRRIFRSIQEEEGRQGYLPGQQNEIRNPSTVVPVSPIGRLEGAGEYDRIISGKEIESILGCSADGSNYREDLIQLLGNGVHPPTACKAFRVLLKKLIV